MHDAALGRRIDILARHADRQIIDAVIIKVACCKRRAELLTLLARDHGVATVLVESGPGLLGSLFDDDLIDEAVVYVAPMLLGDELARSVAVGRVAASLTQARKFRLCRVKRLGDDVELTYRRETVPLTTTPGTAAPR